MADNIDHELMVALTQQASNIADSLKAEGHDVAAVSIHVVRISPLTKDSSAFSAHYGDYYSIFGAIFEWLQINIARMKKRGFDTTYTGE